MIAFIQLFISDTEVTGFAPHGETITILAGKTSIGLDRKTIARAAAVFEAEDRIRNEHIARAKVSGR